MPYRVKLILWRLAIMATMLASAWGMFNGLSVEHGLLYRLFWSAFAGVVGLVMFCVVAFIGTFLLSLLQTVWDGGGLLW